MNRPTDGPAADGPVSDDMNGRRGNGLSAPSFVPLAEIDEALAEQVLDALGRARIAAYLEPTPDPNRHLLYAAAMERADARTIMTSVWRARKDSDPNDTDSNTAADTLVAEPDLLLGRDTDSEFRALVSDWHVDTVAAIRSAERDLNREDSDWRARISPPPPAETDGEEHFVPPPPPPLPRLTATSVFAILFIAVSIFLLVAGDWLGLGVDLTFLTGIGGILLGTGMLVTKLRAQPSDDDDDGAVL